MTRLHLRPQARVPGSRTAVSLGALGSAAVAGSLAGVAEHLVLPVLAVPVVVAIALRPQFGAYLYLIFAPLIAGIPRGVVAPFIRPSEGLLILIITAWFTRIFVDGLRGRTAAPRIRSSSAGPRALRLHGLSPASAPEVRPRPADLHR